MNRADESTPLLPEEGGGDTLCHHGTLMSTGRCKSLSPTKRCLATNPMIPIHQASGVCKPEAALHEGVRMGNPACQYDFKSNRLISAGPSKWQGIAMMNQWIQERPPTRESPRQNQKMFCRFMYRGCTDGLSKGVQLQTYWSTPC